VPDLAALLVEAGAASAEDVELALARKREQGGTLDTALLELALVPEGELVGFLSRASGLPPLPGEPIGVDLRARRVFPARVAERHGLAPFRLHGRELSLLVMHPVDLAALDEISFMLSLHLVPHVAPEWRVRELMARMYGLTLTERFAVVAQAVRSAHVVASSAAPAEPSLPRAPASTAPAGLSQSRAPAPGSAETLPGVRRAETRPGVLRDERGEGSSPSPANNAGPPEPEFDDLVILDEGFSFESVPESPTAPPSLTPTASEEAFVSEAPPAFVVASAGIAVVPAPDGEPRLPEADEPLAAALAQALSATDPEALLHDSTAAPSPRDAPPHWSREDAFAALESAQGREGVVAVALRYARDFFEAAALFAVTKERVSGQDAVGWEGARERCRSLRVAPDEVALFRAVIETSGPYLGPIAREPGNDAMLSALGRPWPRIALVYPVALRDRIVCILYADNREAPISPRRLGDLLLLAGGLGGAFERILRQAKRIRAVTPPLGGQPPILEEAPAQGQPEEAAPEPPHLDDTDWKVHETARAAESPPIAANGAPDPFHVVPASTALAPPTSFDPAEMVQRLCGTRRGSAERGRLLVQLVQRGPDAAAALRAAFPGPLDVPPSKVEAVHVEERGPVLAAISALGIVATPYLVHLLLEPDAERRRLAALLLGRIPDPAVFLPLADRVFDPDARVREAALGALVRMRRAPDFRPVLERLRRAILGEEPDRAASAASALARLGDAEAIPLLIEALDGLERVSEAAGSALQFLTCRRFGRDARRWLAWWKEHGGQRRVDWLFAALADDDREVRVDAAERLAEGGSPPSPWLADASPSERSEAGRTWRAWWDAHGQPL